MQKNTTPWPGEFDVAVVVHSKCVMTLIWPNFIMDKIWAIIF
ncbi:hypothetical protein CASFOL_041522 [Castilleja foliolosa]|uniref:Uncharacterized protein n=1 Tax=Castilleja foliolosa TaxID=1961234 RepID=A0ABD3BCP7_9LAMI